MDAYHYKCLSVVDSDGLLHANVDTLLRNVYNIYITQEFGVHGFVASIRATYIAPPLLLSSDNPIWGLCFSKHCNPVENWDPVLIDNLNILKNAMVMVYSQHLNMFKEMKNKFSLVKAELNEQMQLFYDDIIDGVNGSYVLK
jgi:hypothetical protein